MKVGEQMIAILVKDGSIFRFEGDQQECILYRDSICQGKLPLSKLDWTLLSQLLLIPSIPKSDVSKIYGSPSRKATISEAIGRINNCLHAAIEAPSNKKSDPTAIKTQKKSGLNSDSQIVQNIMGLKGVEYFSAAPKTDCDTWRRILEDLKSLGYNTVLMEVVEMQKRLYQNFGLNEKPNQELDLQTKYTIGNEKMPINHLKVLLLSDPDMENTLIIQLMQTISSLSGISLEVNKPFFGSETEYLGFIALITPGMPESHKKSIESILSYSSLHATPFFAFKERSIEHFNLIAQWIEFSQDNFWMSVSDISDVFHRLYIEMLSKNLINLAKSNPDEYIDKYADLYDVRLLTNIDAKKHIANAVVEDFIYKKDIRSIFLGSGTVTYYIAERLYHDGSGITIYTNNITVSRLRSMCSKIHIIPGDLNQKLEATVGNEPAEYLKLLFQSGRIEAGVLGMRCYDTHLGFGEESPQLLEAQRVLFEHAPQLIIVAQGEKLFKPVEIPLYDIPNDGWNILNQRCINGTLQLYIHRPTIEKSTHQINNLSRYINRYERMLNHLREYIGNNSVHELPKQVFDKDV